MSPHEVLAAIPETMISPGLRSLVAMRLEQGEEEYGDSYLQWEEGQALTEMKEEVADIVAYVLLEKARTDDEPFTDNWYRDRRLMMTANALFDLTTGDKE